MPMTTESFTVSGMICLHRVASVAPLDDHPLRQVVEHLGDRADGLTAS